MIMNTVCKNQFKEILIVWGLRKFTMAIIKNYIQMSMSTAVESRVVLTPDNGVIVTEES